MVSITVRVLLVGVLLGGCASMKLGPPAPITSMSQLEGKWQGTFGGWSAQVKPTTR